MGEGALLVVRKRRQTQASRPGAGWLPRPTPSGSAQTESACWLLRTQIRPRAWLPSPSQGPRLFLRPPPSACCTAAAAYVPDPAGSSRSTAGKRVCVCARAGGSCGQTRANACARCSCRRNGPAPCAAWSAEIRDGPCPSKNARTPLQRQHPGPLPRPTRGVAVTAAVPDLAGQARRPFGPDTGLGSYALDVQHTDRSARPSAGGGSVCVLVQIGIV